MKLENKILRRVLSWLPEMLSAAGIVILLAVGIRGYLFASPCRVETDCRGLDISVKQMKAWEEQEKGGYNGILDMAGWRTEKQQTVTAVSTGRSKVSGIIAVCGSASLVYPVKILSGDYVLPYTEGFGRAAGSGTVVSGSADNGMTGSGMAGNGTAGSSAVDNGMAEDSKEAGAAAVLKKDALETGASGGTPALSWHMPACILSGELSDALFGSTDTAGELVRIDGELMAVAGVIDKDGVCLLRRADSGQIEYAAFRMSRRYQAEAKARQRIGASY